MARPGRSGRNPRVREAPAQRYASGPSDGIAGVVYDSDVIIEILRGRPEIVAAARSLEESGVPTFEAVVATAAVVGALTAALLEWANDPAARPIGDAVTAALTLLEVQPPQ